MINLEYVKKNYLSFIQQSIVEKEIDMLDCNKYFTNYKNEFSFIQHNNEKILQIPVIHHYYNNKNSNKFESYVKGTKNKPFEGFNKEEYIKNSEVAFNASLNNDAKAYIHYILKNPNLKFIDIKSDIRIFKDTQDNVLWIEFLKGLWDNFNPWEFKKKEKIIGNVKYLFMEYVKQELHLFIEKKEQWVKVESTSKPEIPIEKPNVSKPEIPIEKPKITKPTLAPNKETTILPFELQKTYKLIPEQVYLLGNITHFYNDHMKYIEKDKIVALFIENKQCLELAFLIHSSSKMRFNFSSMNVKNIKIVSVPIGKNDHVYSEDEIIHLYYHYGLIRFPLNELGLSFFYDVYMNQKHKKYNRILFILCYAYSFGNNKNDNYSALIKNTLKQDIFHKETVLIINKPVQQNGTLPRLSLELIHWFSKYYNIQVLCMKKKPEKDSLPTIDIDTSHYYYKHIPFCFIRTLYADEIEQFINKSSFSHILNYKSHEALLWNINQKQVVICDNSMDSFNISIMANKNNIEKLFVTSQFHKNLMIYKDLICPIHIFKEYKIKEPFNPPNVKINFTYTIAFIGDLTQENNIQHIIDGVNRYNKQHKKITLHLIGSHKETFTQLNENIVFHEDIHPSQRKQLYANFDYILCASKIQDRSIFESMSVGIPTIHNNVNTSKEIIIHNKNGFLFDFYENYNDIKMSMKSSSLHKLSNKHDPNAIFTILEHAYSISFLQWKQMSNYAILTANKEKVLNHHYKITTLVIQNKPLLIHKTKIFVGNMSKSLKPCDENTTLSYYLCDYLQNKYGSFELTYDLEPNTALYIVFDPFKNKKNNYALEQIVAFKEKNGGKIILRVNVCDVITTFSSKEEQRKKSRELHILKYYKDVDFFIYNNRFLFNYYSSKVSNKYGLKPHAIIFNGCDQRIFYLEPKNHDPMNKVKIVTHHTSSEMQKGYQLYYDLWKQCQKPDSTLEFTFIGKKVPSMFHEVPVCDYYDSPHALHKELNKHHIYITDSRNETSPNELLEAISCGLPILCSNKEGSVRELFLHSGMQIGELFESVSDLYFKINKIITNYSFYVENIKKVLFHYSIERTLRQYCQLFHKLLSKTYKYMVMPYEYNIVTISSRNNSGILCLDNTIIRLLEGENKFFFHKRTYHSIYLLDFEGNVNVGEFRKVKENNNGKINILYCADKRYYEGLFASLMSFIENNEINENIYFQFFITLEDEMEFSQLLFHFEMKMKIILPKTITYIHRVVLPKCYTENEAHVVDFSPLLIGELMEHELLLCLDCDSILQYNIIQKVQMYPLKYDLYGVYANRTHANTKKEVVVKIDSLFHKEFDFAKNLKKTIPFNDYAFLSSPFLTNPQKWNHVYDEIQNILFEHSKSNRGVYKSFSACLHNLLFIGKTGDIKDIFSVIQYLGSEEQIWCYDELIEYDMIQWSGIKKPWYTNGLYKELWSYYNILELGNTTNILQDNHVKKKINNIFLVCSCHKYIYRIPIIQHYFNNYLQPNDYLLFIVGRSNNTIDNVSNSNIIQLNVSDLYEHLTLKLIGAYEYVEQHFDYKYLVKMDDDMFIQLPQLNNLLSKLSFTEGAYGQSISKIPVSMSDKWHIGKLNSDHPYNKTPLPDNTIPFHNKNKYRWLTGGIYILSKKSVQVCSHLSKDEWDVAKDCFYEDLFFSSILEKNNHPLIFHDEQEEHKTRNFLLIKLPSSFYDPLNKNEMENEIEKHRHFFSFHIATLESMFPINKTTFHTIYEFLKTHYTDLNPR